jgi:type IV pilus biogenesis protein CpaD/CtpE
MMSKILPVAALLLTLAACTLPPESPAIPLLNEQGAPVMLTELARVATLTSEQRRREIAELDAARRLDANQRFQLAALLEKEEGAEAQERSLKLLGGLPRGDARTRALLDLMRQSIRTRIELGQQTARAQELQDRLDQIKALEKSLQQRATPQGKP